MIVYASSNNVKSNKDKIMILDGKRVLIKIGKEEYHCAMDLTMAFIGGKWKTVVLWYLKDMPQRFSALKKKMPEITEKMLSLQLKKLEKDKLIVRKVYPESPPRVEYSLSADGKTLLPVLEALALWGRNRGKKYGRIEEDRKKSGD